jgi:hypothetical protein
VWDRNGSTSDPSLLDDEYDDDDDDDVSRVIILTDLLLNLIWYIQAYIMLIL